MRTKLTLILSLLIPTVLLAQPNRIDIVRPAAPELAPFGTLDIGVRTLELSDSNRADVLATMAAGEDSPVLRYERKLTVEVWYPAQLAAGQSPGGQYQAITRNTNITATLNGKAVRDAAPSTSAGPYPLVVISHGYPGNRYLMSHIGENLASKGYVIVSIDHRDSTYDDQQPFQSTLYNRPLDQRFVLDQMAAFSEQPNHFLSGMVNAERSGVIGYSMGGYGLVNNLGGGYNDELVASGMAPPNGLLGEHATGNADFRDNLDPRIVAGVAVAPWGMNANFWRAQDLEGITVPALYIAGSVDTVAGYENGPRAIYEGAKNSDRYLLTYKNAGHNAAAPYPLPIEIQTSADDTGASHYTDPVWDTVTMNNIMAHFVTAYFDAHLKGIDESMAYLDVVPDGADAVYAVRNGTPSERHTYWKGFQAGTAVGLKLEHLGPGN